jgi:hypothetical protein
MPATHAGIADMLDFESPQHTNSPVFSRSHQMMPYPHLELGCLQVLFRDLRRNINTPILARNEFHTSSMIPIMEQGNIPSPLKPLKELTQRSWPFREGFCGK